MSYIDVKVKLLGIILEAHDNNSLLFFKKKNLCEIITGSSLSKYHIFKWSSQSERFECELKRMQVLI